VVVKELAGLSGDDARRCQTRIMAAARVSPPFLIATSAARQMITWRRLLAVSRKVRTV
jgi:hypothetical protein